MEFKACVGHDLTEPLLRTSNLIIDMVFFYFFDKGRFIESKLHLKRKDI